MSASPHDRDLVSIEVPADVAAAVNARVEAGEYASQGEVVRNGLRLLTEEDAVLNDSEVEQWLRTVAVPIAEAIQADPSRSIPAKHVREHFAAKRARRA
jgi:antitoxin ParD1/3/4